MSSAVSVHLVAPPTCAVKSCADTRKRLGYVRRNLFFLLGYAPVVASGAMNKDRWNDVILRDARALKMAPREHQRDIGLLKHTVKKDGRTWARPGGQLRCEISIVSTTFSAATHGHYSISGRQGPRRLACSERERGATQKMHRDASSRNPNFKGSGENPNTTAARVVPSRGRRRSWTPAGEWYVCRSHIGGQRPRDSTASGAAQIAVGTRESNRGAAVAARVRHGFLGRPRPHSTSAL